MLSWGLPPVFLVLTVLRLSWSLSDEEKKIILDEHNKYRSQVSPSARAMMKMTWDTQLEALARSDAEHCTLEFVNGRHYGRNIFALAPTQNLQDAVKGWNDKKKFYSLVTGQCVPGQMCGSYKQLVWADTERVGCEAKLCEKIEGIEAENQRLLVCKYSPLGNKDNQKPYWKGPACLMCPKGTVCKDNLCEHRNAAGAPRTCLGLLLFLISSATLVGLLL